MTERVSQDILDNMGNGLETVIAERGYTNAPIHYTGDPNTDGMRIVREPGQGTVDPGQLATVPYAGPGVAPQGMPGYAPPPPPVARPGVSQEQLAAAIEWGRRGYEQAEAAAREKMDLEDEAFLARLDSATDAQGYALSQEQKDLAIALRHARRVEQGYEAVSQELQTRQAREEYEEETTNKYLLGMILTQKAGVPWNNASVQRAVMAATTRAEMDATVDGLSQLAGRGATQAVQQRQANGAFTGAPQGPGRAAPRGPALGSGDIGGLLKSRPYQVGRH